SYLRWRHTSSHDRVAADFAAASAWLAEFQSETAAEPAPLDLGAGVAGRLRERFAGDDRLGADLARFDRINQRLRANLVRRSAACLTKRRRGGDAYEAPGP